MSSPLTPTRPRLRWQTRPILLCALSAILLTALLVFTLGHRSFLVESELTLAIVAAALFLFLAYGLYRGVHVEHESTSSSLSDMNPWTDHAPDLTDLSGAADGLHGLLWGLVVFTSC